MANEDGPEASTHKSITECHIMDVLENEGADGVPLSNRCYSSSIQEEALEPERTASYKCRWIHLTYEYAKFDDFLDIVEQSLRRWDNREKSRIMAALKKLRRRIELRGVNGPNFRPGIFPLFGDEWRESSPDCIEDQQHKLNQPLFMATPTLHVGISWTRLLAKFKDRDETTMNVAKSLLEYHYRFRGDAADASDFTAFVNQTPASVCELWSIVIDKRNIITASNLRAISLWPNAPELSLPIYPSNSFGYAFWETYSFRLDDLYEMYQSVNISTSYRRSATVPLGLIGFVISHILPFGGTLVYKLTDFLVCKFCGSEFSTIVRLLSFTSLAESSKTEPNETLLTSMKHWLFWKKLVGIAEVKATNSTELSKLRTHVRDWAKIEAELRLRTHEDGPSEEIFLTLKKLWTIGLIFSANFYLDDDGHIYSLTPGRSRIGISIPWRRRKRKFKQQGEAKGPDELNIPIYYYPRKPGETLWDLERDLSRGLAELKRQIQSEASVADIEEDSHRENKVFLEEIDKAGSNFSLFCLLRVCILSTPSRFMSFNNLVVDFYAKKISRLEWLLRGQATQSIVYQLSRLADELRIAKGILISQREVVTKITERFSAAISADHALSPDAPALDGTDTGALTRGNHQNDDAKTMNPGYKRSLRLANTLRAKARIKYENLLGDLEKLEDTAERLKRQAALLVEIKAEGQNTAIFVFTIVTVIFLPLSFVTSYFGMNTSDIRDLEQGQWIFWAVGLSLTVVVLIALWLVSVKGNEWRTARQAGRLRAAGF